MNALPLASFSVTTTVTGLTPSVEPVVLETLTVLLARLGKAEGGENAIWVEPPSLISRSGFRPKPMKAVKDMTVVVSLLLVIVAE